MSRALACLALLLTTASFAADFTHAGEFEGKRILFVNYDSIEPNQQYVPGILKKMGFAVDVEVSPKALPALGKYDQLWMVSSCGGMGGAAFGKGDVDRIAAFVKAGKGFYNLMDNVPCITEGQQVAKKLYGVDITGDYIGQQVIHVVSAGTVKKLVDEAMKKGDVEGLAKLRRAGWLNGKLYAEDHELLTGITELYEGITLCHMTDSTDLEVILRASDNQSLVAVSKRDGEKVVTDCGFTRLFHMWEQNAATSTKWYQNVAAYLQGKQRADLQHGS
jgi:hypothetical protein